MRTSALELQPLARDLQPNDIVGLIFETFGGLEGLERLAVQPEDGHAYGRRILYKDERFEVILAAWAPESICAPHDHGFSSGAVFFASGRYVETLYRFDGSLQLTGKVRGIHAGETIPVVAGEIHSCLALDGGITLHVYTPPISTMKVYDFSARRTLVVREDCGAWIPCDPEQILSESPWTVRPTQLR